MMHRESKTDIMPLSVLVMLVVTLSYLFTYLLPTGTRYLGNELPDNSSPGHWSVPNCTA